MSFRTGILIIVGITLFRVILLRFDATDLFVDEAQYWLWAQNLEFGYYSKPPMIAWVIRAVTALAGSDARFFIRLPAPLFHMATAFLLMATTRRLGYERLSATVAVAYITLPGVALSSYLFSTDTILLTFYALAMLAYLTLTERRSAGWAILLGLAVGFGMLSKYAMLYFVLCAALSAIILPKARIGWRDASIAGALALACLAPNLWWNLQNGGATFRHTADNAAWSGVGLHPAAMAEFFLAQFGVVGPVLFAGLLLALVQLLRGQPREKQKLLLLWSLPILGLLLIQALLSHAYANWGATAYVAGTIAAVIALHGRHRKALTASFAINGLVTLLLPLATVYAHQLSLPNGQLAMQRYIGRQDLSLQIAATAREAGLATIVTDNRDRLADLFYTLRGTPFRIYARAPTGQPANFYEQRHALPADDPDAILFVTTSSLRCTTGQAALVESFTPDTGFMRGKAVHAYRTDAACLRR